MRDLKENPRALAMGLGLIWLFVQVGLFFFGPRTGLAAPHFGVRYGHDSLRYLAWFDVFLSGEIPTGKAFLYMSYNLFVYLFYRSGLDGLGVVLAQASLTSLAAYCLYRLACRLYDEKTGLLAALFYIVYLEIHAWNFYVMTDSLFMSMLIISLFLVLERRCGPFWMVGAVFAVIFTCNIRPNGLVLLFSLKAYILYSFWRAKKYKALAALASMLILISPIAVEIIGRMLVHGNVVKAYAMGKVIDPYPENYLTMPGTLPAGLSGTVNPLLGMILFASAKPKYFFQLAGMKTWYFFLHARPYYSGTHNFLIVLSLVPTYFLAAWGLASRTEHHEEKMLLILVCAFQTILVALTWADYDGRHLLVILPIIFIFSARGAWSALEKARLWPAAPG